MNSIILKIKFWHFLAFEFIWWCVGSYVCTNIFKYDLGLAIQTGAVFGMTITVIVAVILILIDDYRLERYNKSQQSNNFN